MTENPNQFIIKGLDRQLGEKLKRRYELLAELRDLDQDIGRLREHIRFLSPRVEIPRIVRRI